MKKTNGDHKPEEIENLGDGTFHYNFNIEKKQLETQGSRKKYNSWFYDQVRLDYPVVKSEIQQEFDAKGFTHTVKITE